MIFNTLLLALASALVANAAIYVTEPSAGSACHGGQTCSISWLDDGQAPLLSSIGVTRVAVYTGEMQLVQTIQVVNVSSTHSLTFTPNPKAGPNSGSYYIAFVPASDSPYRGYSPWFSLDNMSGSFASPDPDATSSLPLPSTSSLPTGNQTTTALTTASQSGSIPATATLTSATSGASEATTSGFTTIRSTSSGTASGASSGASSSAASSSGTGTRTAASSTSTPFNGAVSNNVPATGIVWTLLAFLGATLL